MLPLKPLPQPLLPLRLRPTLILPSRPFTCPSLRLTCSRVPCLRRPLVPTLARYQYDMDVDTVHYNHDGATNDDDESIAPAAKRPRRSHSNEARRRAATLFGGGNSTQSLTSEAPPAAPAVPGETFDDAMDTLSSATTVTALDAFGLVGDMASSTSTPLFVLQADQVSLASSEDSGEDRLASAFAGFGVGPLNDPFPLWSGSGSTGSVDTEPATSDLFGALGLGPCPVDVDDSFAAELFGFHASAPGSPLMMDMVTGETTIDPFKHALFSGAARRASVAAACAFGDLSLMSSPGGASESSSSSLSSMAVPALPTLPASTTSRSVSLDATHGARISAIAVAEEAGVVDYQLDSSPGQVRAPVSSSSLFVSRPDLDPYFDLAGVTSGSDDDSDDEPTASSTAAAAAAVNRLASATLMSSLSSSEASFSSSSSSGGSGLSLGAHAGAHHHHHSHGSHHHHHPHHSLGMTGRSNSAPSAFLTAAEPTTRLHFESGPNPLRRRRARVTSTHVRAADACRAQRVASGAVDRGAAFLAPPYVDADIVAAAAVAAAAEAAVSPSSSSAGAVSPSLDASTTDITSMVTPAAPLEFAVPTTASPVSDASHASSDSEDSVASGSDWSVRSVVLPSTSSSCPCPRSLDDVCWGLNFASMQPPATLTTTAITGATTAPVVTSTSPSIV
ncbi:hypothetical protein BC828DRAFT_150807 [Blastocladiella britannica]|nr:hypothetical protein BC828DRAFT_150807 [Blastocladiella britannica]